MNTLVALVSVCVLAHLACVEAAPEPGNSCHGTFCILAVFCEKHTIKNPNDCCGRCAGVNSGNGGITHCPSAMSRNGDGILMLRPCLQDSPDNLAKSCKKTSDCDSGQKCCDTPCGLKCTDNLKTTECHGNSATSFYDGCNECTCVQGVAQCTERACFTPEE